MNRNTKLTIAAIGVGIVLTMAILGLVIATFVKIKDQVATVTTVTETNSLNSILAASIHIEDVMNHLKEFQRIATANDGTRAVNTKGFNQTLDYITNTLGIHTDHHVSTSFFYIRQFALASNPILISSINGTLRNYTYSTDLSAADFYHIQFSTGANFPSFTQLTAIPNEGCSDADWNLASPSPAAGRVALVKRDVCAFDVKSLLAAKYNVSGLLIYNDGTSTDRRDPIAISLDQSIYIPALFLSYSVGQALVDATRNSPSTALVRLVIEVQNLTSTPIGNICADTKTGDPTQTIVIGSHSDSVPAGAGINDNGSGSAANLELAIVLARLFQTSTYATYKYRVRFCWWGAEEIGLLGADDHVKQAMNTTVVGNRLSDYLINLNYDMLGSPNFIFGIYDGNTANNDTPSQARPGSNRITTLFQSWFEQQNLPWTYTDFSGRSDYGPFLAKGIVAGGLFSGADDIKSQEERDYYDRMLGQGMGGIPGAIHDPCYHQACDSIQNVNIFGYEKLVQAAAYVLEYLGRKDDLEAWLYPSGRPSLATARLAQKKYNSINEYYQMPYL